MKARPSPAAILRDGRGVYHRAAPCADPLAASSGWGQCCVAAAAGHGSCNPARAVPI